MFYARVLADPDLAGYFTGVDLNRLKRHQSLFIGQALGATRPYPGPSMRRVHQHLEISGIAFDQVVQHLTASLAEAGLDEATIGTVAEVLLPLRADIVTVEP
ncbi:group 1 truncated hemoglobin [Streptomyces sp. M19]